MSTGKTGWVVTDFVRWRARIRKALLNRPGDIERALANAAELPLRRATTHYLTGAALKVDTGHLRRSVRKQPLGGVYKSGNSYWVTIGTHVRYGRAWEKGFKIPAQTIVPKAAKALKFNIGGRTIFAKKVNLPARTVGARPWLKPAFDDTKAQVRTILLKAGVITK